MSTYYDWKPFDTYDASCDDCGLEIHTTVSLATLNIVNDRRIDAEQPPIEKFVESERTKAFDKEWGLDREVK